MAMTGILRPGHAQLRVLDLEQATRFYRDIMGLVETGRDGQGRVYFKCWDEHDHSSLILRQADGAGIDFIGFKVLNASTLDQLDKDIQAFGLKTERVPAGDLLETGERVRFVLPTGHVMELYAEKTQIGNGLPAVNPAPWAPDADRGMAPVRFDHCLLYGPNVMANKVLFMEVLGFHLVERILGPAEAGEPEIGLFFSCSHKTHDIAFVEYPEPGKLHHLSFRMPTWERVLRAGDIMGMNKVPIDIGPTRHGVTRGETIYAWDPSGNRFETFAGGYEPYPDSRTITWTFEGFPHGLDFPQGKLHDSFLTVVT
ncbi:catechol 2,3-dioxygenase [Xanthobacter autotrophicus]|uniref:catechol 2,3-dioxygenase n=1 Tax=Xanthobacter TaxID=279 RepID=UPI0024AA9773|nr:catechol 2,3-dioxygenase [Xanthobacter autotrophicus]MDI4665625.1 catechol 2,3-dioxygenase [Xanthobacter autotrophicus]